MTTECICWRKHSVNFAKGESCPRTIETLQAAWDRDQELIEEQRQELAKKTETINQLRQQIKSLKASRAAHHKEKENHNG